MSSTRCNVSTQRPFSFTLPDTLNFLPAHIPSVIVMEKSLCFKALMSKFTFSLSSTLHEGTSCPSLNTPLSSTFVPTAISSIRTPSTSISLIVGNISSFFSFMSSVSKNTLPGRTPMVSAVADSTHGRSVRVEKRSSAPVGFSDACLSVWLFHHSCNDICGKPGSIRREHAMLLGRWSVA